MSTYDYLCNRCGIEAEYTNLSSQEHPSCVSCGSDNMKRLPSTINISGISARVASLEDICRPQKGMAIEIGFEDCPIHGDPRIPVIRDTYEIEIPGGISEN